MNQFLDWLGDFLEKRRGLLPLIGLGLIVFNLVLQLAPGPGSGWLVDGNIFLHFGLIISIIGLLLVRVL